MDKLGRQLSEFDEVVTENLARPFVVSGRRAYLIGYMNGAFPDMGHHLPGEMGGLWSPPLKLTDGFWFGLTTTAPEAAKPEWQWLYGANCRQFVMQAGRAQRDFVLTLGGNSILARQEIFVPEGASGVITSLTLANQAENDIELTLGWLVRFDIQSAWWSNWPDRPDEAAFDVVNSAIVAHDSLHTEWCAVMMGELAASSFELGAELWAAEQTGSLQGSWGEEKGILRNPAQLQGAGISGQLNYQLKLAPGETQTLHFALAGGLDGEAFARETAQKLLEGREVLWQEKQNGQQALIAQLPFIKSPSPDFNRVFDQSSLCLDMLTLEIPALGRGIIAGLHGFAWLFGCDTYYTLSGLLISGQSAVGLDNLRLLAQYARQQNGRIPHEITQTGEMFNPGNTVEAGEFVTAVERAFRWTGDQAFLNELYPECKAALFDYMLGECDPSGTLLPDGPGILELSSAEHGKKLDVACSLYQALESMIYISQIMNDVGLTNRSRELAKAVRERINRYFWLPERQEYAWRIEPDLSVHPDEPAHSYVMLEMGVLGEDDAARIARLFAIVESPEHTSPKGLIHPGTADFVMPIQNAIIALAEFRYGRPDKALWYLERCAELCGYYMPWAIPEFVGQNACFIQAWSSAAFNWLVVQGLFRLNPDPATNTIIVQPQLPSGWDFFEFNNLNIWGTYYDLRLERREAKIEFSATVRTAGSSVAQFEIVANPTLPVTFV